MPPCAGLVYRMLEQPQQPLAGICVPARHASKQLLQRVKPEQLVRGVMQVAGKHRALWAPPGPLVPMLATCN